MKDTDIQIYLDRAYRTNDPKKLGRLWAWLYEKRVRASWHRKHIYAESNFTKLLPKRGILLWNHCLPSCLRWEFNFISQRNNQTWTVFVWLMFFLSIKPELPDILRMILINQWNLLSFLTFMINFSTLGKEVVKMTAQTKPYSVAIQQKAFRLMSAGATACELDITPSTARMWRAAFL